MTDHGAKLLPHHLQLQLAEGFRNQARVDFLQNLAANDEQNDYCHQEGVTTHMLLLIFYAISAYRMTEAGEYVIMMVANRLQMRKHNGNVIFYPVYMCTCRRYGCKIMSIIN